MVLRKDEAISQETLLAQNRQRLMAPVPYREILSRYPELSLDSQGFFSQADPEIGHLAVKTGSLPVETNSHLWGAGGAAIDLEGELINVVKHEVQEILKYGEELNPEMTFEELGVKSLNAVEIIGALNTKLDLYLKTTLLFSYPTIEALGKYILAQYGQELRQKRSFQTRAIKREVEPKQAETPEELSALLSEIETMSQEEMEALQVILEGTSFK
jgi:acyl carrier protein